MNASNTPTIGARTGHLLSALRALHGAKNHYYLAEETLVGEELAAKLSEEADTAFEAAEELIERQILDDIRTWAFCPGDTEI